MSLKETVDRVRFIYQDCAPEAKEALQNEALLDDFARFKKKIHASVKDARKLLKDRDVLLNSKNGNAAEAAQVSYQVRMCIKAAKEDITAMEEVQRKADKREMKKKKQEDIERNAARREVIILCHQHIAELEQAEKRRGAEVATADRQMLFIGAGGGAISNRIEMPRNNRVTTAGGGGGRTGGGPGGNSFGGESDGEFGSGGGPTASPGGGTGRGGGGGEGGGGGAVGTGGGGGFESQLPDIDVAEDLLLLQQRGVNIDRDLEDISAGVGTLKALAQDMNQEIEKQNAMLDEIEVKVDKAEEHIKSVNVKMKKALDGVMKGDRFMINCILLTILLALIGFCASYLTT